MNKIFAALILICCSCKNADNNSIPINLLMPNLSSGDMVKAQAYYKKQPMEDSSTFLNIKFGMDEKAYVQIIDSINKHDENIFKIYNEYRNNTVKVYQLEIDKDTLLYFLNPTYYKGRLCGLNMDFFMPRS